MSVSESDLNYEGISATDTVEIQQDTQVEHVSVVDETNPSASPRVAKLVPIPGNPNSFYLAYDGKVMEGGPVYTLPTKPVKRKAEKSSDAPPMKSILKPGMDVKSKVSVTKTEAEPETLLATNQLEALNTLSDNNLILHIKSEDMDEMTTTVLVQNEHGETTAVIEQQQQGDQMVLEGTDTSQEQTAGTGNVLLEEMGLGGTMAVVQQQQGEDEQDIEGEEDYFEEPGEVGEMEVGAEDSDEPLPLNIQAKIDQVVQHGEVDKKAYVALAGGYKFSGTWKKPPKQEGLMKARLQVLQQILDDYKRTCKICFEEQHINEEQDCPLWNPDDTIQNKPECKMRFGMPDEIVFGVSRVYEGEDSLFARDEIPEYTQFGPIEGKIVTMQDLATMGVVQNGLDVSNLWPLPIEQGQHEFDFQYFLDTQELVHSNWLKFIKVESPKEEHPPHNIQTVYKDNKIYFVTTKEIEPGGELFLRAFEPPSRVYYNMHRLGEVFYNYCRRLKCKTGGEALQLHNLIYFVRHQRLVHSPEFGTFSWAAIYNCNLCGQDCFDSNKHKEHMNLFHRDEELNKETNSLNNKCKFCDGVLKTKKGLYAHIRRKHPSKNAKVVCSDCGKSYKNMFLFRCHYDLAHLEEPMECKLCGKQFMNKIKLKNHMRKVHKEVKNYKQCEVCGTKFKQGWSLKVHMRTHQRREESRGKPRKMGHRLGEVYYNFCSRSKCKPSADERLHCPSLLSFVRHQFLVHQPEHSVFSWAAIYNCTFCQEDCFDKETYQQHMKKEHNVTNIKRAPNTCRFCGIVLKTKNYMYKHIQIHHSNSDSNQVPCPFCGKFFKHTAYLQNHIQGSHTDDPQPCPVCNRICKNRYRMRSHLRKVHQTNLTEVEQIDKDLNQTK